MTLGDSQEKGISVDVFGRRVKLTDPEWRRDVVEGWASGTREVVGGLAEGTVGATPYILKVVAVGGVVAAGEIMRVVVAGSMPPGSLEWIRQAGDVGRMLVEGFPWAMGIGLGVGSWLTLERVGAGGGTRRASRFVGEIVPGKGERVGVKMSERVREAVAGNPMLEVSREFVEAHDERTVVEAVMGAISSFLVARGARPDDVRNWANRLDDVIEVQTQAKDIELTPSEKAVVAAAIVGYTMEGSPELGSPGEYGKVAGQTRGSLQAVFGDSRFGEAATLARGLAVGKVRTDPLNQVDKSRRELRSILKAGQGR